MRATNKHLELYKKEILKWITIFKIGGWEVHFDFDEKNDGLGNTRWNMRGRICTFCLARKWGKDDPLTVENIKITALHEALHMLFIRMTTLAGQRFVSEAELEEAREEAVNTLMNYILEK